MNPFPPRALQRALRMSVCAGVLIAAAWAAPEDDRVAGLNEQIRTLETVVASSKDTSEKQRLDQKLQRLRQELKILQDRAALEARERELTNGRTTSTLDQLRERLRGLDVAVDEIEANISERLKQRRQAAKDRDALTNQLAGLREQKGATQDRIVEQEERLATQGEQLRALALEAEAGEAALELAQDAKQLRERIKTADTNVDRPTLRALFESFTKMRAEQKTGGQLTAEVTDLKQKLEISQGALDLSRQKLAKYDEELALLERGTGLFRRDERVERLLAQQRNQKAALDARMPWLVRQVEAIKATQNAVATRQELATLRASFETGNFEQLKAAYLYRLRWPVVAIGGLVILKLIVSYLLLPLIYQHEALFLARRFARYIAVLLAAGVLAGFLFADLSMIVATLGIVSAALVISLQDVCASVAGWAVIMAGGKFNIGDRLEIDGTLGDVIDIQLLRTTMLEINGGLGIDQPTGRVIVLPNNFIFKFKIFNSTHGHPFIWGKIDVTITFGTPVAPAVSLFQRVLVEETHTYFEEAQRAAATMQRRYGVNDAEYKPHVNTIIADSGVTITLYYVSHYRRTTEVRNRINERLIAELERRPEIQLAYNTLSVLHSPATAGQPAALLGSSALPNLRKPVDGRA